MSAEHDCPIEGCQVKVAAGKLLCSTHWWKVPIDMRARINVAWKGVQQNLAGAREIHRQAMKEAIAHVNNLARSGGDHA